MPLKLNPPKEGRSPFYRIRGTYLGIYVDRSAGTADKRLAQRVLKDIQRKIESGQLTDGGTTFYDAAHSYLKGGGEERFIWKLVDYFGRRELLSIDHAARLRACEELYPGCSPATWNRAVFTPISAIIHHVDPDTGIRIRRPKGAQGEQRTQWVTLEQFVRFLDHASDQIRRLAVYLVYTGSRLGEALALDWDRDDARAAGHIDLGQAIAIVGRTKNGDPRGVHLPPVVIAELANIEPKHGRVFGYRQNWDVYPAWREAAAAAGIAWFTPHVCRHTYATWMRQQGADAKGLLETGAWRDIKSVLRYMHAVASEEAKRADLLPAPARKA